ncbi:hypothetical protein AURDEDRAFT_143943 [Auricularia subglabra TFB-10046 SS5]|nr:hypothetical protein AURDEDRAFT_143943 [Auricularia subglabra TFB-10046 SS5]
MPNNASGDVVPEPRRSGRNKRPVNYSEAASGNAESEPKPPPAKKRKVTAASTKTKAPQRKASAKAPARAESPLSSDEASASESSSPPPAAKKGGATKAKAIKPSAKRAAKKPELEEDEDEPTDPSSWPESTVKEEKRINKMKARDLYRLKDEDIKGLKTEQKMHKSGYPMTLYLERDIERVAWQKHGGPQGLRKMLDKLKARYDKVQASKPKAQQRRFRAPRWYYYEAEASDDEDDE